MIVCSKDPQMDLKESRRVVPGCKYYNKDVHRAAFTLPEFGRVMLEEGRDIRPVVGDEARAVLEEKEKGEKKKILLLGSGFVARPCAEYVKMLE